MATYKYKLNGTTKTIHVKSRNVDSGYCVVFCGYETETTPSVSCRNKRYDLAEKEIKHWRSLGGRNTNAMLEIGELV